MSITNQWVYPPNWDNNYPNKGFKRGIIQLNAEGETAGETDSTKVSRQTIKTVTGQEPRCMAVDSIKYDVGGYNQVELFFDDSERTPIATLSGIGKIDFCKVGGKVSPKTAPEDGYSGDIMLTSTIFSGLTGSYTITMEIRPKD